MRATSLLGVSMMVACYRTPAPVRPAEPAASPPSLAAGSAADADEPTALVAMVATEPAHSAAEPARIAAAARQTLWVGGCNTACIDCSLGSYQTYVVGMLTRTGERLFPTPDPPQAGYQCGAEVAIGERVTLVAHSPTEHMVIDSWRPFFASDACPCADTQAMTCTFTVTAEIASHHERIYCGAAWKQHATAQIGD